MFSKTMVYSNQLTSIYVLKVLCESKLLNSHHCTEQNIGMILTETSSPYYVLFKTIYNEFHYLIALLVLSVERVKEVLKLNSLSFVVD